MSKFSLETQRKLFTASPCKIKKEVKNFQHIMAKGKHSDFKGRGRERDKNRTKQD